MGVKQSIDDFILDASLKSYSIATADVKGAVKGVAIFVLKGYCGGFHSSSHKSLNNLIEDIKLNSEEFSEHPIRTAVKLYKKIKKEYELVDNYHLASGSSLDLTKGSIKLGFAFGTASIVLANLMPEQSYLEKTFSVYACWEYFQATARSIHLSYFQTPIGSFKYELGGEVTKPFLPFISPFFSFLDKVCLDVARVSAPVVENTQKTMASIGPSNFKYLLDNPVVNYMKNLSGKPL